MDSIGIIHSEAAMNISYIVMFGAIFATAEKVIWLIVSRALSPSGSRGDGELLTSFLSISIKVFAGGVLFLLAVSVAGLASGLFYRMIIACQSAVRSFTKKPSAKLVFGAAKIVSAAALFYLILWGNHDWLHVYGVLVFTAIFLVFAKANAQKWVEIEGGDTMNKIKAYSVFAITYFLALGLSELLWVNGGIDLWIWFFAFAQMIVLLLGMLLVPIFLVFLEAVNDSSRLP